MSAARNNHVKSIIDRGDIISTQYTNTPEVGRYQGNGRFGCVYSKLGLHAHPSEQKDYDQYGKTQYMHIKHWGRFSFHSQSMDADTTADYILPLMKMYWENTPENINDYSQAQSFYNGTLTTSFTHNEGSQATVTTWFDAVNRNLSAIHLEIKGTAPCIMIAPVTDFMPYPFGYKDTAAQRFSVNKEGDNWVISITCVTAEAGATSQVYIHSNAEVEVCAKGLRITPKEGQNQIYISYGEPVDQAAADASLKNTTNYWNEAWDNSGWLDLPEETSHSMWVRSMAYILSTFNNDQMGFISTNGFTGNPFPFNFAQDMFYIQPALLASGQVSILKAWIESYSSKIDGMKDYAKRLWPQVDGIFPPWELPYGSIEGYHSPSVPIIYCYEPHNSAYLARMAHEAAVMVNDPEWTETHVVPLIREIALFYRSFCTKEEDGYWHLFITPSIGQDEAGGHNQKDYLCSLYSASYSFQRAVEYGLDADGAYQTLLEDGLAFSNLLSEKGFLYASAGSGMSDYGTQKHPVQLNGLAYLPIADGPTAPEIRAYEIRYESTDLAKKPYFFGWTLGEFLLAGSRMQDAAGWQKDWSNVRASNYTDENWVQIYETSDSTVHSFYVTTHGLFAQSLYSNIISDYYGKLVIAPCNVYGDSKVSFGNVHSVLGVKVSGEITGQVASVTLEAWKDCELEVHGHHLKLHKGEQKALTLHLTAMDE